MSFPEPLVEIADFLRDSEELGNELVRGEGRAVGKKNELAIIRLLQNEGRWAITSTSVGKPHDRQPHDMEVMHGNAKLYVDIKTGTLETVDNVGGKGGVFHALTGLSPGNAPGPYNEYFRQLEKHSQQENDADYYFLAVETRGPTTVPRRAFICSMRTLARVVPSGDNLPFQCRWSECREPKPRNYQEAKRFLLGNFRASLEKRAERLGVFKGHFPGI